MPVEIEPKEFDLIVLGTGLQESIIAGAAARAGKSVLQLDANEFYGSDWASYNLEGFLKWAECQHEKTSEVHGTATATCSARDRQQGELQSRSDGNSHITLHTHVELFCWDTSVASASREYSVDLAPKLMFCSGEMVDLMLRCNAHNYMEFKLLQGHSLWQHGRLSPVPASRADIFKDRRLSPSEKRRLMRFLKQVLEEDSGSGALPARFGDQSLVDVLEEEGLSGDLQEIVLYGLVLAHSDQRSPGARCVSACEGKDALLRYAASANRYGAGTGAFLVPLYGAGEVPQAFCRVGAVGGATYVLRCPVERIEVENRPAESAGSSAAEGASPPSPADGCPLVTGVRTADEQLLRCSKLVGGAEALAPLLGPGRLTFDRWISRCIAITDAPLQEGEWQALVVIPPRALGNSNPYAFRVLQFGHSVAVCPKGRYLVYFCTRSDSADASASSELGDAVRTLLRAPSEDDGTCTEGADGGAEPARPNIDVRPRALVLAYFKQAAGPRAAEGSLPPNAAMCSPPDEDLDYREAVESAERIYSALFPGEALFPREAPPATADDSDDEAIAALGETLTAAGLWQSEEAPRQAEAGQAGELAGEAARDG